MRPFHQAGPNAQAMLVDRGNRPGAFDGQRAAARRSARRPLVGPALAALAFQKLFLLGHVAQAEVERNRARTA
ncbi:MAG: hypothetical protein ACXVFL_17835 [Solirubrobacteraceae bacterium]